MSLSITSTTPCFFSTGIANGAGQRSHYSVLLSLSRRKRMIDRILVANCLSQENRNKVIEAKKNEEEEYKVVTAIRSKYNDIVIVDSSTSRFLLLDSTQNVHSLCNKDGQNWTGSYWDEFASLPAIVPEGPIAIYGLGGGTAARLMLQLWPSLQLHGWEIDGILIDRARQFLGLSDLEESTKEGGRLHVHIGDVFTSSEINSQSYAGIVIDLFSEGSVLTQLQEVKTWLALSDRLLPNGRLMVNCGGIDRVSDEETRLKSDDAIWVRNSTIRAMSQAFPGQVSWKGVGEAQGQNFVALTGPLPDLDWWSSAVATPLSQSVKQWRLIP